MVELQARIVFEGKARQGLISALTPRIARAEQWPASKVRQRLEDAFPAQFEGEQLFRILGRLVAVPWGDRRQARRNRKRRNKR